MTTFTINSCQYHEPFVQETTKMSRKRIICMSNLIAHNQKNSQLLVFGLLCMTSICIFYMHLTSKGPWYSRLCKTWSCIFPCICTIYYRITLYVTSTICASLKVSRAEVKLYVTRWKRCEIWICRFSVWEKLCGQRADDQTASDRMLMAIMLMENWCTPLIACWDEKKPKFWSEWLNLISSFRINLGRLHCCCIIIVVIKHHYALPVFSYVQGIMCSRWYHEIIHCRTNQNQ